MLFSTLCNNLGRTSVRTMDDCETLTPLENDLDKYMINLYKKLYFNRCNLYEELMIQLH